MKIADHIKLAGRPYNPRFREIDIQRLARVIGVKKGTTIRFEMLPKGYVRGGDVYWDQTYQRFVLRISPYEDDFHRVIVHEFTHIVQSQRYGDGEAAHREFMKEYHKFSTALPKFNKPGKGTAAYYANPFEIEATQNERRYRNAK